VSAKTPAGPLVAKRDARHALLGKHNPHHDERGRFTTADDMRAPPVARDLDACRPRLARWAAYGAAMSNVGATSDTDTVAYPEG
jgi:hypothetical protein